MATSLLSGALAASAQSSLVQSREDRVLQQIQSGQNDHDNSRIEKGAKEFESILLNSWLQQAEKSMASVPGAEDDEDSTGRDQMMSLGVQQLSNAMVASGGIGIAKMISKALHGAAEKAGANSPSAAATGDKDKIHVGN